MRILVSSLVLLISMGTHASAQQVADSAFHLAGLEPAFAAGTGPRACIDSGHHNFHTGDGRYLAFANLLRDDGYRVSQHAGSFSLTSLSACDILVIAGALAEANAQDWSYPHASAFSADETTAVLTWVRDGGSLLLIVDHSPWPGANGDLGILLGAHMLDGYVGTEIFGEVAEDAIRRAAQVFGVSAEQLRQSIGDPGQLGEHAILKGRSGREAVTSVTTFTGHAFLPAVGMDPLLLLSADAIGAAPIQRNLPDLPPDQMPTYAVGGWLQGGAVRIGSGRAVVLGEAAMCTAQLAGPQRAPMGMNNPLAPQNAQFCLNVVHWLSGLLDE